MALFCVTLVVVALPVAKVKASAGDPITFKSCEYTNKWHAIETVFTNTSDRPVKALSFLVMSASGPIQIVEHDGDFAPGVETLKRTWADLERTHAQVAIRCVPSTVTFADGTSWQNPSVGVDLEHTIVQTPGSPIRIRDCRAMDSEERMPVWHYTYVNRASQPATNVSVGLVENGVMLVKKDDAGTFSPGIEIVRESSGNNIVPNDALQPACVVLSATFADGTSWTNPSSPAALASWPPISPDASASGGHITITGCDSSRAHYRNDGPLATRAVDIALIEDGHIVRTLRDAHDLAPQDELTSGFFAQNEIKIKDEKCVPIRVDYADGTEWINPALRG